MLFVMKILDKLIKRITIILWTVIFTYLCYVILSNINYQEDLILTWLWLFVYILRIYVWFINKKSLNISFLLIYIILIIIVSIWIYNRSNSVSSSEREWITDIFIIVFIITSILLAIIWFVYWKSCKWLYLKYKNDNYTSK